MDLLGAGWRRGIVMAALVLVGWPAVARAGLSWSGPVFLNDGAPTLMVAIACPSASQCTAVDYGGKEVSFNPTAPAGWSAYSIDPSTLTGVACPAAGECVAVDQRGREVTFDPRRIGAPHARLIDVGASLVSIACPTASECAAGDSAGRVISFDPASPGRALRRSLSSSQLAGIACPSSSQCTVIDSGYSSSGMVVGGSRLITFDPADPSKSTKSISVAGLGPQLACPTSNQCVALASPACSSGSCEQGGTVTFNPESAKVPVVDSRSQVFDLSLACPSTRQCTAMDASGYETTFDPNATSAGSHVFVDPFGDWPKGVNRGEIACPSVSTCTVVSGSYPGSHEMTFDPAAARTPPAFLIDDGAPAVGVSCPSSRECVTLAQVLDPYLPWPVGVTVIVNPRSGTQRTGPSTLAGLPAAVSCPTSNQCTVVTGGGPRCRSCRSEAVGLEMTFNPAQRTGASFRHGRRLDRASLTAVACPKATECVATDIRGLEITFNPRHPLHTFKHKLARGELTAVACTSVGRCIAAGVAGQAISFAPWNRRGTRTMRVDGLSLLTGLSCPAASQCTAVDRSGREITFDPATRRRLARRRITPYSLAAISCLSTSRCAVVGSHEVSVGNPLTVRRWTANALPGASALGAVACRRHGSCLVADRAGHAYIGR